MFWFISRQRVSGYFRQLSFISEPRGQQTSKSINDSFVTKYLESGKGTSSLSLKTGGPEIQSGKEPYDMPELLLGKYDTSSSSIVAACTGPEEGLCGIQRSKLHLSAGPGKNTYS